MSALTTATFVCSFIRFSACLRMILETSMPTTSLTFSTIYGNNKPVPQPASSMKSSFLRMGSANASFIFASCSS